MCDSAFSPITVMTTMADLVSKWIAAVADSIKHYFYLFGGPCFRVLALLSMHDDSLMAQERHFHELLHSRSTVHWCLSLKIMPTLTCSHYFKNLLQSPSVGCFVLDKEMEKIRQFFINSLKKYEKSAHPEFFEEQ